LLLEKHLIQRLAQTAQNELAKRVETCSLPVTIKFVAAAGWCARYVCKKAQGLNKEDDIHLG